MKINEIVTEDISRRGFLKGVGALAGGSYLAKNMSDSGCDYYGSELSCDTILSSKYDVELSMPGWIYQTLFNEKPQGDEAFVIVASDVDGLKASRNKAINAYQSIIEQCKRKIRNWKDDYYPWSERNYIALMKKSGSNGYSEKHRYIETFSDVPHPDKHIEEDTAVNMSPYKDAINNAETPKRKSAKKKVEQLFVK